MNYLAILEIEAFDGDSIAFKVTSKEKNGIVSSLEEDALAPLEHDWIKHLELRPLLKV